MYVIKQGRMGQEIRGWALIVLSMSLGLLILGCQEATKADTTASGASAPEVEVTTQPTVQTMPIAQEAVSPTVVSKLEVQSDNPLPKVDAKAPPTLVEVPVQAVKVNTEPIVSAQAASADSNGIPKITVDSRLYDYGEVGVSSKNTADFQITNEGTGTLKITEISKCCGAVITINDRDVSPEQPVDLAPGQIASVQAVYQAPYSPGTMKKEFNIISNDPNTPALTLSIKATVVAKMEWGPRQIRLSQRQDNAGFPKIHIKALDGKPFSIQRFWSTGDAVTLNFDPNLVATEMTVQPHVVMDKLEATPQGRIRFYLSREDYYALECYYDVLKPYSTNPASFLLFKADPNQPVQKKLWILDNYAQGDDYKVSFEIESIKTVEYDMARVISQKPLKDGIEVVLEMTPPDPLKVRSHMFSDKLEIRIKNEPEPIEVMIKGFYTATVAAQVRKLNNVQQESAPENK